MEFLRSIPDPAEEDGPDADTAIPSYGPNIAPPCDVALEAAEGDDEEDDD